MIVGARIVVGANEVITDSSSDVLSKEEGLI